MPIYLPVCSGQVLQITVREATLMIHSFCCNDCYFPCIAALNILCSWTKKSVLNEKRVFMSTLHFLLKCCLWLIQNKSHGFHNRLSSKIVGDVRCYSSNIPIRSNKIWLCFNGLNVFSQVTSKESIWFAWLSLFNNHL